MSVGANIVTGEGAPDLSVHIKHGFIEVDPGDLRKGDEIRAELSDDPENTLVEGWVINEPALNIPPQTSKKMGSVLVNSGLVETFIYPEGHPTAGHIDERKAPTIVLPMGAFNDLNDKPSDVAQAGKRYTVRQYRFFARPRLAD